MRRRVVAWLAALQSGGVSSEDRVLLTLPLGWAIGADAYLALLELGALTLAQEAPTQEDIAEFGPTVLVSTPTDALRLARPGDDLGLVKRVVVTGEPGGSLDVTRRAIEDRWGARCQDVYALTELGPIGWGCLERGNGIHLAQSELSLQVVEPTTDQPVEAGQVGELVVTTPADWDARLVKFHTGDLVRLGRSDCTCGTEAPWAEGGVLGRDDERLIVQGQPLLPSTIEQVVRRHPAAVDFGLRVYSRRDECAVAVRLQTTELLSSEGDRARVATEVAEDLRRSLGIRIPCDVAPAGECVAAQDPARRARRLTRQSS